MLAERRPPSWGLCTSYRAAGTWLPADQSQLRGPGARTHLILLDGLPAGLRHRGQHWLLVRDCWGWVTASGPYTSGMIIFTPRELFAPPPPSL